MNIFCHLNSVFGSVFKNKPSKKCTSLLRLKSFVNSSTGPAFLINALILTVRNLHSWFAFVMVNVKSNSSLRSDSKSAALHLQRSSYWHLPRASMGHTYKYKKIVERKFRKCEWERQDKRPSTHTPWRTIKKWSCRFTYKTNRVTNSLLFFINKCQTYFSFSTYSGIAMRND